MTGIQLARQRGRALLALAALTIVLGQSLWVASPGLGGGMWARPTVGPLAADVALWLAVLLVQLVALGWMVRIHRAIPEPDHGNWRYRAR